MQQGDTDGSGDPTPEHNTKYDDNEEQYKTCKIVEPHCEIFYSSII